MTLWLAGLSLGIIFALFLVYIYFNDLFLLAKQSKILRRILGLFLVIIGIAGIFLPIIPGWLLIFLGLALLRVLFLKKIVRKIAKKMGVKIKNHHLLRR